MSPSNRRQRGKAPRGAFLVILVLAAIAMAVVILLNRGNDKSDDNGSAPTSSIGAADPSVRLGDSTLTFDLPGSWKVEPGEAGQTTIWDGSRCGGPNGDYCVYIRTYNQPSINEDELKKYQGGECNSIDFDSARSVQLGGKPAIYYESATECGVDFRANNRVFLIEGKGVIFVGDYRFDKTGAMEVSDEELEKIVVGTRWQ